MTPRQLRGWLLRLFGIFHRGQCEREFAEELASHLHMHIEDNLRAGMSPEEARRVALINLGGVAQTQELYREQRGVPMLETLFQDIRFGLRMLRKNPGFSLIAMLTLSLGIGANTAIFSVVNAVVLRPLPYKEPQQLALLWTDNVRQNLHEVGVPYVFFEAWSKQSKSFSELAVCSRSNAVRLGNTEGTERVEGALVSASFFSVMGVSPVLGRGFSDEEEVRGSRVVVLSYELWQRQFGAAADALGKTIEINGQRSLVVGVMPASFQFPAKDVQLWEPVSVLANWAQIKSYPYSHFWRVIGRLKTGVTWTQAQAEMNAIGKELERTYPADPQLPYSISYGVNVVPLSLQLIDKNARLLLWILFGAVGFVLLIAAANVANLFWVRGMARQREFATRLALGAGRVRLVRQLLTESGLLAVLAGILGIAWAALALKAIIAFGPSSIPRLDEIRLDARVLAFTLVVSLLTGLLFGLLPAWKLLRRNPNESLKEGGRGMSSSRTDRRVRNLLVITEFALALVLLTGAGLLVRSFLHIQSLDPGFNPAHVLTLKLEYPRSQNDEQTLLFYRQVRERVAALPGVRAVGLINELIIEKTPDDIVTIEDHPAAPSEQLWDDCVSPGYFQAMGTPLRQGRFFTEQDDRNALRVAIINETMARRFWPGADPLGKRFKFGNKAADEPWLTVVGVVADMRRQGLEKEVIAQAFVPHSQSPGPGMLRGMNLIVRTDTDPLSLATAVRQEIRSIDKTVPLFGLTTLERQLEELIARRRFQTLLLAFFSTLALLLAGLGVYGLLHYSVVQRTQEIGIRMALGATAGDVQRLLLGQGLALAAAGIACGLMGALGLTQTLGSLLHGVTATDPVTFIAVPCLLLAVACLASYLPARRATKVDPLVALRHD